MEKNINLNNANDFENNKFNNLKNENFDDFFESTKIALK